MVARRPAAGPAPRSRGARTGCRRTAAAPRRLWPRRRSAASPGRCPPRRRGAASRRRSRAAAPRLVVAAHRAGGEARQAHVVRHRLGQAVEQQAPGEGALGDLAVQELRPARSAAARSSSASLGLAAAPTRSRSFSISSLHARQLGPLLGRAREVAPEQGDVAQQEQPARAPTAAAPPGSPGRVLTNGRREPGSGSSPFTPPPAGRRRAWAPARARRAPPGPRCAGTAGAGRRAAAAGWPSPSCRRSIQSGSTSGGASSSTGPSGEPGKCSSRKLRVSFRSRVDEARLRALGQRCR